MTAVLALTTFTIVRLVIPFGLLLLVGTLWDRHAHLAAR